MGLKVCKFGGTSMADGNVMNRVKSILLSDKERKYVIVSAPGKRYGADIKVTDLLYSCYEALENGGDFKASFNKVRARFVSLTAELNIDFDITSILDETEAKIIEEHSVDFTASRGEYLCAIVFAKLMDARFVDSADVIKFKEDGKIDERTTYHAIADVCANGDMVVFPGFYGTGADGRIKTFSRGGSDITGSIVARALMATIYENWTDVSGFYACDPRIVNSPKSIKCLSYKELRELSYMGANVLHSDSIFPVRRANIPIVIKNTFRPEDEGTTIVPISNYKPSGRTVTGVAGHKNFTVIFIEKSHMNSEVGFVRKVLSVLERNNISVEHIPTGIDTMSIVIESAQVSGFKLEQVIEGIKEDVRPDVIRVSENIALIATVGHGMSSSVGTSAKLFKALAESNINIKMIDQGSSEMNIIVAVKNEDCEKCISAIYHEFFN